MILLLLIQPLILLRHFPWYLFPSLRHGAVRWILKQAVQEALLLRLLVGRHREKAWTKCLAYTTARLAGAMVRDTVLLDSARESDDAVVAAADEVVAVVDFDEGAESGAVDVGHCLSIQREAVCYCRYLPYPLADSSWWV